MSTSKAVPEADLDDLFAGTADAVTAVEEKKAETQKELVADVRASLRQQAKEIEKDSWMFEAPRTSNL